MTCREIEKLLTEDLYEAHANRQVRDHLDGCADCRRLSRELEEIENLKDSLAGRATAPEDLPVRVARGFSRARIRRHLFQLAVPLMGLFIVAATGSYLQVSTTPGRVAIPAVETRIDQDSSWETWEDLGVDWRSDLRLERRESQQPRYLEVVVSHPEGPVIVEVPATIEIRLSDPGRDYLAYVSH